jgi:hypothetical protein
MAVEYQDQITAGLNLKPISGRQPRDHKKNCHHSRKSAAMKPNAYGLKHHIIKALSFTLPWIQRLMAMIFTANLKGNAK